MRTDSIIAALLPIVVACTSMLGARADAITIMNTWGVGRRGVNDGLLNVAAEYEVNPHLSIFGRIDNLANEHYSEVFGFPALGRAAYGGVKLRF